MKRILMIGGAFAVAATALACNNAAGPNGTIGTSGTAADDHAKVDTPITLTGCLQQGSGSSDFILTPAKIATHEVGTSGSNASNTDAVAQEQERAASRSYRLNGDSDQMKKMVGTTVRITGTMTDRGDLNAPTREERGTAGTIDTRPNARPETNIAANDLAQVKVDSINQIAAQCGTAKK